MNELIHLQVSSYMYALAEQLASSIANSKVNEESYKDLLHTGFDGLNFEELIRHIVVGLLTEGEVLLERNLTENKIRVAPYSPNPLITMVFSDIEICNVSIGTSPIAYIESVLNYLFTFKALPEYLDISRVITEEEKEALDLVASIDVEKGLPYSDKAVTLLMVWSALLEELLGDILYFFIKNFSEHKEVIEKGKIDKILKGKDKPGLRLTTNFIFGLVEHILSKEVFGKCDKASNFSFV